MGRLLMYTAIGLLAVFVGTATFLTEGGGGSTAAISQVSVHNLRSSPQTYLGQIVTTEGRLAFSDEHGLYQVVSEDNLAVVIREYKGSGELRRLDGKQVRVTGQFGVDPDLGIFIDAAEIRGLD